MHKQGTLLRHVLPFSGSSCDHIYETLAKYFDKIEGANIETNTQMAREIFGKTELVSNESVMYLNLKSLYTNVPLKEAV